MIKTPTLQFDAMMSGGQSKSSAEIQVQSVNNVNIVIEGCCHGELEQIYASIALVEQNQGIKVDLLICCGDFQSLRNTGDFHSLAVPQKYKHMQNFHKYYSGENLAPVLTLFIGGNHEASNALQELFYGGWVAPNIYYLGRAGCVRFGGLKIAGLSGIFNQRHYNLGHFEKPPYNQNTVRSVYHVREMEVFKLAQIQEDVDIFISHDWPTNIAHFGNKEALFRKKGFLRSEVEDGSLGSPPGEYLLDQLRPAHWFAAHLHVKFAALKPHPGGAATAAAAEGGGGGGGGAPGRRATRFLSLDKCLPNRDFLQLVSLPRQDGLSDTPPVLEFDEEWLAITKKTHGILNTSSSRIKMPAVSDFVTPEEIDWAKQQVYKIYWNGEEKLAIPNNFEKTVPGHNEELSAGGLKNYNGNGAMVGNPQTDVLLECLELPHKVTVPHQSQQERQSQSGIKYSIGAKSDEMGGADGEGSNTSREQTNTTASSHLPHGAEEDDEEEAAELTFFIDRGPATAEKDDEEEAAELTFFIDRGPATAGGSNRQDENDTDLQVVLAKDAEETTAAVQDPSEIDIDEIM